MATEEEVKAAADKRDGIQIIDGIRYRPEDVKNAGTPTTETVERKRRPVSSNKARTTGETEKK